MTQQEANKLMNDRYNKELEGMKFPAGEMCDDFGSWLRQALPYHNMYTLQCNMDVLIGIRSKPPVDFNMLEMINAINAVQQTFEHQFSNIPANAWEAAQLGAFNMSKEWTALTKPIEEAIKKEVQAQFDKEARADDERREAEYKKQQNRLILDGKGGKIRKANHIKM